MKKQLCAAALLGALASGCVTTPPAVGDDPPRLKNLALEKAYQEVLERYSARAEIYEGFDTRLFAGATLQTLPFREARVRRRAHFQFIPESTVEGMLAEERAEAAREHVVFLGVHTSTPRHEDFDRRDSIWRLVLVTPSGQVRPTRIQREGRANLDLRAIYPYMGDFWVAYTVRFPTHYEDGTPTIPPDTEQVVLRVASTLGSAELKLNVQ